MTLSDEPKDFVHLYMNELKSRIVAESGVPSDQYHIGKIIFHSLNEAPDFVNQIDGDTGHSETNSSVLDRSVRCALALKDMGLRQGDVMILMAPNHLDLAIPFYAGFYLGAVVSPIDKNMEVGELKMALILRKPKIIFCQSEKIKEIKQVLNEMDFVCQIITFDTNEEDDLDLFQLLLNQKDENIVRSFRPTDFETSDAICCLLPTSGTTGDPKAVALTHKGLVIALPYVWTRFTKFPTPTSVVMVLAPLQFLTTFTYFLSTVMMRSTRLQTTKALTIDHVYHIINKYKPTTTSLIPTFLYALLNPETRSRCDFSCLEAILVGGTKVSKELIQVVQNVIPKTQLLNILGSTEACLMCSNLCDNTNSCGPVCAKYQYRLVDLDTNEDILEPNVQGELWIKGPCLFKEYYNNPEETKNAFAEGGWYKTGDILYKDAHGSMCYVDRKRLMFIHYTNNIMTYVSPLEIEDVIRKHPGVGDVCVTSVPDPARTDLPVACVVLREGFEISAQQIKDLVKDSLPVPKQLSGGVIFMKKFPITPAGKINRRKLKQMVSKMERQ